MYLLNALTLQSAQQIFISSGRFRTGAALVGVKDGVNRVFTTPGREKFTQNLPFVTISLYFNGIRQILLEDYILVESSGPDTGYDTVIFERPPRANDTIISDYIASG
ncbi:MAG: hypothetical protein WC322_03080 [Candidatus Paceibacterota bacterium]